MNFIKHIQGAFSAFDVDDRLNATHISLYMALFLQWNRARFPEDFYINRSELMRQAKIGSKSTYHRCLANLNQWDYIDYFPSHNPYKGSRVKMSIFGTTTVPNSRQAVYQRCPIDGQALVPIYKHNKQRKHHKLSRDRNGVILFFLENEFSAEEGQKFFDYYRDKNWCTADGEPIQNWQALALTWIRRANANLENKKQVSQIRDNLRTTKEKNYGEPL